MFTSLSLLIPLRGNLPRRERLWQTLRDTLTCPQCHRVQTTPIEIVVRIDEDDTESEVWVRTATPRPVVVRGPRLNGWASLPRFFNEMAHVATGNLLMAGNDDMTFHTADWPAHFLAEANRYPDGIFNLGAMTFPAGAFPFSCLSRIAVDRLGFFHDERLLFLDIFLRDVFARFGRTRLLPFVQIKHVGAPDPQVDAIKRAMSLEADAYWQLHTRCVHEAVNSLKNPKN